MFSAVLGRELTTMFRAKRMLFFQLGLIAVYVLLVMLRWPSDNLVDLAGIRSQQVFRLFAYGLLATLMLLLPVFPATSLVREKQQGTLALLLNTPLGAARIYFGKLLGTLSLAGVLIGLSLPSAAACYALGGLSLTNELPRVYAILVLVALQYSAIGLFVSARSFSIDGAIRMTYGAVLALGVIAIIPNMLLQGTESSLADAADWLRCVSPVAALMSLLGAGDVGSQGLLTTSGVPIRFTFLSILITIMASGATLARLNHRIFDYSRAQGRISNDRHWMIQVVRRVMFLVDPQRRSGGIPLWVNPVMVKEFRCRRFGRLHWLLRLTAVCAMLSLGLAYSSANLSEEWGVARIGSIMVYLQTALVVLITPSLAAGLIVGEREGGGWALLQATPLSVFRIVSGKLLSVVLTLVLLLCATLPGYWVMVHIDDGIRSQVERVVVCLAATAAFAMMLSAGVGSLFRRTAAATIAAYIVLIAICTIPLLVWAGRNAPFGHSTVEAVLMINPIAAPLSVIRDEGFADYQLIPGNWWFMGVVSAASLGVLIYRTGRIWRPQ